MERKINIAIVDDQNLFRAGLERMLSDIPNYRVVISAANGTDLLGMLTKNVDILLMDVSMPDIDGIELVPKVKKLLPDLRILALSMYDNPEYVIKLMNLGVNGYLLKDSDIKEIQLAISKAVLKNEIHFTEVVSNALLKRTKRELSLIPMYEMPIFSAKERELIQYICDGLSASEVSDKMNISVHTVNGHKERVMQKMKVKNTAGLVSFAHRNGLISV